MKILNKELQESEKTWKTCFIINGFIYSIWENLWINLNRILHFALEERLGDDGEIIGYYLLGITDSDDNDNYKILYTSASEEDARNEMIQLFINGNCSTCDNQDLR